MKIALEIKYKIHNMQTKLTENDIKVLKDEKRMGYIFSFIILSFGAFFNLIYFLSQKNSGDYLQITLPVIISMFILLHIAKKF